MASQPLSFLSCIDANLSGNVRVGLQRKKMNIYKPCNSTWLFDPFCAAGSWLLVGGYTEASANGIGRPAGTFRKDISIIPFPLTTVKIIVGLMYPNA